MIGTVISAVRLYGSEVRSDSDAESDIDVLVVYRDIPSAKIRSEARSEIERTLPRKSDIAEYSEDRIRLFFTHGHLFAWHLFYESRPLVQQVDRDFIQSLGRPCAYSSAKSDILNFRRLLCSTVSELERAPNNVVFEAGLLYLIARNIGMSASAVVCDRAYFSRAVPMLVGCQVGLKFPLNEAQYRQLVACRHSSQRGADAPQISRMEVELAARLILKWCDDLLELISENSLAQCE